jgi:hypothetical protein
MPTPQEFAPVKLIPPAAEKLLGYLLEDGDKPRGDLIE